MQKGKKRAWKIGFLIAFVLIAVGLMVFLFSGDNFTVLKDLFNKNLTKDQTRDVLERLGFKGYFTIGILSKG